MEKKCSKKVKFGSEKAALFAITKIKKESTRKTIPIRAYLCKCGAWHLTSRPDVFELQKQNDAMKLEIMQLKKQIEDCKLSEKKEARIKIRADERVKEHIKAIQNLNKELKELRNGRNQLISDNIILRKKLEENGQ